MENLAIVLRQLRDECKQAQLQADKLEEAISVLQGLAERSTGAATSGQPKRRMSAAGRRRIAQAQRARWARLRRRPQAGVTAKSSTVTPAKRKLSPDGRRRIAAATRARWARVKAQQTKRAS